MKKILAIVFMLSLLGITPKLQALDVDFGFGISPPLGDSLSGDTTYKIGGTRIDAYGRRWEQRDPTSELKFPLDVSMARFRGGIQLGNAGVGSFEINLELRKNITEDAGKMEDSDWGILYDEEIGWPDPDSLDIYSESDAELDAFMMDLHLRYHFPTIAGFLKFSVGIGYKYQHFEYEISNLDQWYPSENEYYGYD